MGMNQDERSSILFFWQKTLGQVENNYYAFVDADFNRTIKCPYATGFRIYDIDMANDTFLNDRNPELFSLTSKVGTWDGRILGLFAILTGSGHAGTQVQVDWARLYDPSASDVLTVAWTTAGLLQCDPKYYTVQLWVDTDNSGHDGDLYITGLKNDGSYDVFLSSLPPGDYYFYLKLILQGDREFFTVATSGYSARVRVNAAPSLRLDAPSMTSGDDYAAAARGSAWDMADASGIAGVYDVTNIAYAGGLEPLVLHAFNARRRAAVCAPPPFRLREDAPARHVGLPPPDQPVHGFDTVSAFRGPCFARTLRRARRRLSLPRSGNEARFK